MVFKRPTEAWISVFLVCLFVGGVMALIAATNLGGWLLTLSGITMLLGSLAMAVSEFKSAKYYCREDHLHIKGINGGYWTDEKIAYRDILSVKTFLHNRTSHLLIMYWHDTQARKIAIPAPSHHVTNNQAQKMIDHLASKVEEANQVHIISPKFLAKRSEQVIADWDSCLFYDESQRSKGTHIALIHDGSRMILLGDCWRFTDEKVIETMPPKVEMRDFIGCHVFNIAHVDYSTAEGAASDLRRDDSGNMVRAIDCLAEELRTSPRNISDIRRLQKRVSRQSAAKPPHIA